MHTPDTSTPDTSTPGRTPTPDPTPARTPDRTPAPSDRRGRRVRTTVAALGVGLTAPALAAAMPAPVAQAAGNTGVRSVHWDACSVGWGFACPTPFGIETNVLRVSQSVAVDTGELVFHRIEGTSVAGTDHLALQAEFGAECKSGYRTWKAFAEIDGAEYAGRWFEEHHQIAPFAHTIDVPAVQDLAPHPVDMAVPLDVLFPTGNVAGFPDAAAVLAEGEEVVAERIADGWTESDARQTGFSINTGVLVDATIVCRGIGPAHSKYAMTASRYLPLTIEYLPSAPGVRGTVGVAEDLFVPASVTDVALSVVPDPADACVVHLSATIQTDQPTTVEYRFVDPWGQPSNTYSVDVDESLVAFVSRPTAVPEAPGSDPQGDLATVDGEGTGGIGGVVTEADGGADLWDGVFEIEVLSPNSRTAVDGFAVPYCERQATPTVVVGEVAGTAVGGLTRSTDPTH